MPDIEAATILTATVLVGLAVAAGTRRRGRGASPPSAQDIAVRPDPMPAYGH